MNRLNIANDVYGHFKKLIPQQGEGTKATLFWEFSKRIQYMKGTGDNPGAIIGEQQFLISVFENFDIKPFLNKMK